MADFDKAFERMIQNEGGYQLTDIAGDRGGQTYAGIARKMNPDWAGWRLIDRGDMQNMELSGLVRDFYRQRFWQPVRGDEIDDQDTAESVFDFAVNAGVSVAAKLAQLVAGTVPDGRIGPATLAALNKIPGVVFRERYALAKIKRYADICSKDRSQSKFLLGWINRALKGLA